MIKIPAATAEESAAEDKKAAFKQPKIIVVFKCFEALKNRAPAP